MKKLLFNVLFTLVCNTAMAQGSAIKTTILSWFTGSTKIAYERASATHPLSTEFTAVCIGAGYDKYDNRPSGGSLRLAEKFFLSHNSNLHPLRGIYLRPEALWSNYRYAPSACPDTRTKANMLAMLATWGIQWDFGHLLLDTWIGGGYAVGNPSDTGYMHGFQLWKWLGSKNYNIAMSFSFRIGYCF